jgi:AbrB family looped-hinge helix DNA binding protein
LTIYRATKQKQSNRIFRLLSQKRKENFENVVSKKVFRSIALNPSRSVRVLLESLTGMSYLDLMKALVTSKGQVTIPKELRDKFGIEPGSRLDFIAASDGIHLRKVVDRSKRLDVLGCLKKELAGRSVGDLLDELRGPVELPGTCAKR